MILIVESDKRLRMAMMVYLKGQGEEPISTATAQEAMNTLQKCKVDLVILDLKLDNNNSLNVLKHIRGSPRLTALPVLVVSAWDMEPAPYDYLDPGDYLVKPFDMRVLNGMVRQLLGIGQSASGAVLSKATPPNTKSHQ